MNKIASRVNAGKTAVLSSGRECGGAAVRLGAVGLGG